MSTYYILIPLALVILVLMFKGGSKSKDKPLPTPKPLPRSPRWLFFGPNGITGSPTSQGSGYTFDFLNHAGDRPRYVIGPPPPPMVVGQTLTMAYNITGSGFVAQEHPEQVASTSLYIQGQGDISNIGVRWWSQKALPLVAGGGNFSVLLDPLQWINAEGQHDPVAFAKAIGNPAYVGNTFGSENGRGHGVYATQPSEFTLISMGVQR